MANSPNSATQSHTSMFELRWSHTEKAVARRAFDLALGKEWKPSSGKRNGEPPGSRSHVGVVGFGKLAD